MVLLGTGPTPPQPPPPGAAVCHVFGLMALYLVTRWLFGSGIYWNQAPFGSMWYHSGHLGPLTMWLCRYQPFGGSLANIWSLGGLAVDRGPPDRTASHRPVGQRVVGHGICCWTWGERSYVTMKLNGFSDSHFMWEATRNWNLPKRVFTTCHVRLVCIASCLATSKTNHASRW